MSEKVIYNGYNRSLDFNGSDEEAYLLDFLRSNELVPEDIPMESVIKIVDGTTIEAWQFTRNSNGARELSNDGSEYRQHLAHFPVLVEWKDQ